MIQLFPRCLISPTYLGRKVSSSCSNFQDRMLQDVMIQNKNSKKEILLSLKQIAKELCAIHQGREEENLKELC